MFTITECCSKIVAVFMRMAKFQEEMDPVIHILLNDKYPRNPIVNQKRNLRRLRDKHIIY